ncbi:alpha-L-rhamnosidase [Klebsiella pneumoniae]|uniref:Alpha-L-rhamnosidase n=1 Tax=Klebsiella pneumoniae TaxID=573 RepID=A0A378F5A1_KLEPN|nr:alpha-L-rhamnosidase [Klebsiella pneumoniae]
MIRHPRFLQRAADLTPALQRLRQTPQAIVEAVAEPGALNGWRGNTVRTPERFISNRSTSATASLLILAAILLATCSSAAAASAARPMPGHLHFTFGETLSEVCEPFSEYQDG